MKEIPKGYSLTEEEEAIVRGEVPGNENDPRNPDAPQEPAPEKSRKTLGALLPVLGALLMMIGIAYLFIWLLNTPERRAAEAAAQQDCPVDTPAVSDEQKAVFARELALTDEESAAFWPLYTRFQHEQESADRKYAEWRTAQDSLRASGMPADELMNRESAEFESLMKVRNRFHEAFSALLGEERATRFFVLYTHWNRPPTAQNP